ncbi:MAG: aminotransferase class I/II-fold pyridoxal phosphate-dependent enzyme, partial [Bacteroidota bacterium]
MENLSRRNWLKSSFGLASGLIVSSSLVNQLMAAPASQAEREYFSSMHNGNKKVRLNSNENPYGPSDKAKKAVTDILSEGNRYAFNELDDLRKTIAQKNGVDPSFVLLGAGSGELLVQTGIAFGIEGGRVLSGYPTFTLLMNYAEQMGATWDRVDLNKRLEYNY